MFSREVRSRYVVGLVGSLAVLVGLCGNAWAETDVDPLSLVPADAMGFVLIKNFHQTAECVNGYVKQIAEIVSPGQTSPDVEAMLTEELGLSDEVALDKPIVLAFLNWQLYGSEPIVILCQARDYQAFSQLLEGQESEEPGVMKGTTDNFKDCYFAKVKDTNYIVLAPKAALVKAILTSQKGAGDVLSAQTKTLLAKSDAIAHVSIQAISTLVKPLLMVASAMGPMMAPPSTSPSTQSAEMQAIQSQAMMVAQLADVLDQLADFNLGLNLDAKYIKVFGMFGVKPDTELASIFALQKPTEASLLKGIPGGSFLVAGGSDWQWKLPKFYLTMLNSMPDTAFGDPAVAKRYKEAATQLCEMVTGVAGKVSMGPVMPGRSPFMAQQVIAVKDSKKYLSLLDEMMGIVGEMALPTATGGTVKMTVKHDKAVATIGGVTVDQYSCDLLPLLQALPMSPQRGAMEQMMIMMFVPEGKIKSRIAAVNDKTVITDYGSDDTALEALIATAKAGTAPLGKTPKVVEASQLLPKKKVFEAYIDLGEIVNAVGAYLPMIMMMGGGQGMAELPTTLPSVNVPAISMAATVSETTLDGQLVLPFEVIKQMAIFGANTKRMFEGGPTSAPAPQESGEDQHDL